MGQQQNAPAHQHFGIADPTKLEPFRKKGEDTTSGTVPSGTELLQAVIETPRGSRNKYSWDEEQNVFTLKSVLPAGMVFPYDFGFIPQTFGGDGDALDVLVLMDEPAFPGCALLVRLLGVIEAEQTVNAKTYRNDRLIAVAESTQIFAHLHTLKDLPEKVVEEIESFFVNYHRLLGKTYRPLARKGAEEAMTLIRSSRT